LAASLSADEILTQPLDERELIRRLEQLGDLAALERERRLRTRLFVPYQTGRYAIGWHRDGASPLPTVCVVGGPDPTHASLTNFLPAVMISYVERSRKLTSFLAASPPDLLLVTRPDDLVPVLAAIDEAETPIGTPVVLAAHRGAPAIEQLPPTIDLLALPAPAEIVSTRLRTALRVAGLRRWLRRPPQPDGPTLLADSLTGLYNAGLLLDYLSVEGRQQEPALIAIDVANLGEINARAGYAAGNAALAGLGRRLSRVTRPDDVAAYVGSGRFAVAVAARGRSQLERLRQRLAQQLGKGSAHELRLLVGAETLPLGGNPAQRLERIFRELARLRPAA
jgi:diguanylate cyclase (GGDEF)-like protein